MQNKRIGKTVNLRMGRESWGSEMRMIEAK